MQPMLFLKVKDPLEVKLVFIVLPVSHSLFFWGKPVVVFFSPRANILECAKAQLRHHLLGFVTSTGFFRRQFQVQHSKSSCSMP